MLMKFKLQHEKNPAWPVAALFCVFLPVGTNTVLKIAMEPEAEQLNEVVVTALGIKREKKALGYAMQEVKTDGFDRK